MSEMKAVHWLRSRQERNELDYWFSLLSYNRRDVSASNRIYFVYLIVFFSIWVFVTLSFLASGGASLLQTLGPSDPAQPALLLEVFLLGGWSLFAFGQALLRSPVVFSKQDLLLLCQMPVQRRQVVLRWLVMPWLKSAVPFWLVAITLGFSLAETQMTDMSTTHLFQYAGYGIRPWLAVLPVQLTLFVLQWTAGVLRLKKGKQNKGLFWLIMPLLTLIIVLGTGGLLSSSLSSARTIPFFEQLFYPLQSSFTETFPSTGLLISTAVAILSLLTLALAAASFSINRAAQETQQVEIIQNLRRYGLNTPIRQMKTKKNLGISRAPSKIPFAVGPLSLVSKGLLQARRSFRLVMLLDWLYLFSLFFGFSLLPDFISQIIALFFWVMKAGKISTTRLRSDLASWSLVRQLPISAEKLILLNLIPAYLLITVLGLAGVLAGSILPGVSSGRIAVLIPGICAAVAGMAAYDVIRRSRTNLLLTGFVPEVGAGGVILGLLSAGLPVFLSSVPGFYGLLFSLLLSFGLGWLGLYLAAESYRKIKES